MTVPLYQNDPRWKNQKIGVQNSLTIEQVGCLLTSMAMVVNYFGAQETPASLNERMKVNNGFTGAWIKAAQVPGQFSQLGMQRQKHVVCEGIPAPVDLIDVGLAKGSLVVVRVDWTPNANIDSHWVVIYQKQGNDYLIWDPWQKDDAADTLLGRYGFGGKGAADVILEAIWHGKGDLETPGAPPAPKSKPRGEGKRAPTPVAPPASPSPSPPARPMAVQPTIELKFRQQPQTGAVLRVLPTSEILTVLDAKGAAKIGQPGAWLHVQDAGGQQGYVAAWLVQETAVTPPQPAPTPSRPQPAAPSSAVRVQVNAESLSFRTQPHVSGDTLIRYLTVGEGLTLVNTDDKAKIGQEGQWLHVRASDGKEGYVAAWYVVAA